MQSTHGTQPQSHAVMPTIVHGGNVMSGFGSSAPEKPAESAAGADLLVGSLQTPPVTRSGGHLACLKHAMATIRSSSTTTATTTAPTDIINNILKPPCNSFYREHDCHHRCRYTQHHRDDVDADDASINNNEYKNVNSNEQQHHGAPSSLLPISPQ